MDSKVKTLLLLIKGHLIHRASDANIEPPGAKLESPPLPWTPKLEYNSVILNQKLEQYKV